MSTNIKELTDENLICMVAGGDPLAFEEIDRRWRKALVGFISMKVANVADAEDLAQTVLVRAWERAGQFNEESGAFKSWIRRAASNAIVDSLRRKGRKKRGGSMSQSELIEDSIEQVPSDERQIDFGSLTALVESLPCRERRAIVAFLNEESVTETESRTELTRSKIMRLRQAALERMRDSVCEREGGEVIIRQSEVCTRRVQQTLF